MNIQELIFSAVLDAAGMLRGVAQVNTGLNSLGVAAAGAGTVTDEAATQSAKAITGVGAAATVTGKKLAEAAETGSAGFEKLQSIATKALAVLGGVALLKSVASTYLQNADAVGKFADAMGEDVVELQAWGEAAARAGGTAEGLYNSLGSLNEKAQEFAKFGEGEGKKVFEGLGISVKDAGGKVKNATTLMGELAARAESMDKAQFAGIVKKLGLDPGAIMLLQSGKKAVDELIKRQKELGVYTKEDAELAAKANDALADMAQAAQGVGAVFMRVAGPAIVWMADRLTNFIVWVRQHESMILSFFGAIGAAIGSIVLPMLYRMAAANLVAFAPFYAIGAVIAALGGLFALLYEDFVVWSEGGESYFGDMWQTAVNMFNGIASAGAVLWNVLAPLWQSIVDIWNGVLKTFWGVLLGDFGAAWEGIKQILGGFNDYLYSIIIKPFLSLFDLIMSKIEGLKSYLPAWAQEQLGFTVNASAPTAAEATRGAQGAGAKNVNSQTQIGNITVQTQATDAQGIARDIGSELSQEVNQMDGALAGGD